MKNLVSATLAMALFAPAAWAETNLANGPRGAHYANGSAEPICSVSASTQDVSCTGTVIGGVGNTNAVAVLSATYSATVQCRNHGGQIVEVKTQVTEGTSSGTLRPSRNGQIVVPPLSTTVPTDDELTAEATCPNRNWRKVLLGDATLVRYVYTMTFAGFTEPFISKVGP